MQDIEGLRHVIPDKKIALFVTPKCGSTSIASWYLFQTGLMPIHLQGKTPEGTDVHTNTNIFALSSACRIAREDFYKFVNSRNTTDWTSIKFVRNPYKRMVSAFFQILSLMNNGVKLSFREFVDLPRYYFSNTGIAHINTGEPHARLQATTREVTGELVMNHVFSIEEGLTKGFKYIENKYELRDSSNVSFNENISSEKNPINLYSSEIPAADVIYKASDINQGIGLPPQETFLDDYTKERIYDIHKSDFEVYGFDKVSGELNHSTPENQPVLSRTLSSRALEFLEQNSWDGSYIYRPREFEEYDSNNLSAKLNSHKVLMEKINRTINKIDDHLKIIIYGTGELLLDMIMSTDISKKNVVGVTATDISKISYPSLILDNLGWEIILPVHLKSRLNVINFDRIIIASIVFSEEIADTLNSRQYRVPDEKIIKLV